MQYVMVATNGLLLFSVGLFLAEPTIGTLWQRTFTKMEPAQVDAAGSGGGGGNDDDTRRSMPLAQAKSRALKKSK